jgi:hypothetical protein
MDLVECREFQFSFSGTWWHSSKESRYRELWKTNRILVFFVVGFKFENTHRNQLARLFELVCLPCHMMIFCRWFFKFENTHRNQYLTLEVQSQKSKKVGLSLV